MAESTEKLLNIIRESSGTGPSVDMGRPLEPGSPLRKRIPTRWSIPSPWRRRRRRLGVDISPRGLHLMLTTDTPRLPRILGFREISYPSGIKPDSPGFPMFLRREVQALCGRVDDLAVWTHAFSPRAQFQNVLIPKAPPWEIYNLAFWRLKKDNPFDESEFLLDLEVQGQVMDKGSAKLCVLCCLAPRKELAETKALFAQAGLPLAGLTLGSLALQTMFRARILPVRSSSFATLHIGRNWSRIDIFSRGNLTLSRVVKTGMNSMAEALIQGCNEKIMAASTASLSPDNNAAPLMPEIEALIEPEREPETEAFSVSKNQDTFKNSAALVHETHHMDALVPGSAQSALTPLENVPSPQPGQPPPLTLDQGIDLLIHALTSPQDPPSLPCGPLSVEEAFSLAAPVTERLARQVERTFEYNVREQGHERVETLLLSGDLSPSDRMRRFFHDILGVETRILDPLNPDMHPSWRTSAPATPLERVRHNLALSLALCDDGNCVNLLRTYQQREEAKSTTRVNMAMYVATIAVLLLLSVIYGLQGREIRANSQTLAELDRRLAEFSPRLSGDMLMDTAHQVRERQEKLRALSSRLEVLAMLREVSALTPEHIRLFNIRIDAGSKQPGGPRTGASPPQTASGKALVMDGMIIGDPMGFETALAGYIIALQRSPLFDAPQVHDKRMETGARGEERMRFVLHVPVTTTVEPVDQPSETAKYGGKTGADEQSIPKAMG